MFKSGHVRAIHSVSTGNACLSFQYIPICGLMLSDNGNVSVGLTASKSRIFSQEELGGVLGWASQQ
jgi:hypothetical protein